MPTLLAAELQVAPPSRSGERSSRPGAFKRSGGAHPAGGSLQDLKQVAHRSVQLAPAGSALPSAQRTWHRPAGSNRLLLVQNQHVAAAQQPQLPGELFGYPASLAQMDGSSQISVIVGARRPATGGHHQSHQRGHASETSSTSAPSKHRS